MLECPDNWRMLYLEVSGIRGAIETPFVFSDGLGDLLFEGAFGIKGVADFGGEVFEGGAVFVGHGGDLASDAVTPCVEGGTDFSFRRGWARRFLGVLPVCCFLLLRCGHVFFLFVFLSAIQPLPYGNGSVSSADGFVMPPALPFF